MKDLTSAHLYSMHYILSNIRTLCAKLKMNNHDVFELFNTIASCVLGIMKKHADAHCPRRSFTSDEIFRLHFKTTHKDMSPMDLFRRGGSKFLGEKAFF